MAYYLEIFNIQYSGGYILMLTAIL